MPTRPRNHCRSSYVAPGDQLNPISNREDNRCARFPYVRSVLGRFLGMCPVLHTCTETYNRRMSILPVLLAFVLAYATAWAISRMAGVRPKEGRYATIDGLRGYLAFSVMLYHTIVWWGYLRGGRWVAPDTPIYRNFGEGAVALFFMITGFLFSDKLMATRGRDFDWLRLYVSRFMRLTPLYAFAVLVVGAMSVVFMGGLHEPLPRFLIGFARWFLFALRSQPDLNGMAGTWRIVAGVFWTLPYEWLFYLLLPALAAMLRVRAPYWALGTAAVAALVVLSTNRTQPFTWLMFAGGFLAAGLVRRERWIALANTRVAGAVAVVCLGVSFALFRTSWGPVPLVLLTTFFCIVAAGNGLFGLFYTAASRTLGDMAYSIYLLHGIFLFTTFSFILSPQHTAAQHWGAVLLLTPVLVASCFVTFTLIELPGISGAPRVTMFLRRVLSRGGAQPT
jgi:peptidoglycan/LPS O-acetylase OafA/YrhL